MNHPRNRLLRWLLDTLLLPLAIVIVLIEDVLWKGALLVLRRVNAWPPVRALQIRLGQLPATIALPLFLIPEVLSHVAGAYATLLLAQGRWAAALAVGVLVKGSSMLVIVWIYQSCAETLLQVAWFARLHHWALAARDWAIAAVAPIRARARAMLTTLGHQLRTWLAQLRGDPPASQPLHLRRRLLAWRTRIATWLGTRR